MKKSDILITSAVAIFGVAGGAMIEVGPRLFPSHEKLVFWSSLALMLCAGATLVILFVRSRRETSSALRSKIGNFNTVCVDVVMPAEIGNFNTLIGSTDHKQNAIYNTATSIGFGAGHSPGSVIIGAFAGSKSKPPRE